MSPVCDDDAAALKVTVVPLAIDEIVVPTGRAPAESLIAMPAAHDTPAAVTLVLKVTVLLPLVVLAVSLVSIGQMK